MQNNNYNVYLFNVRLSFLVWFVFYFASTSYLLLLLLLLSVFDFLLDRKALVEYPITRHYIRTEWKYATEPKPEQQKL